MAEDAKLTILILAKDKASGAMGKVSGAMKKLGGAGKIAKIGMLAGAAGVVAIGAGTALYHALDFLMPGIGLGQQLPQMEATLPRPVYLTRIFSGLGEAATLGVLGTDQSGLIGITTANLAETASTAVSLAIDTLNTSRSNVGAAQNRLTFAAQNLASAIENAEAARSTLLDLDVAREISTFTSKQVLLQTGIAMLAQANQLPQNLLRLFQ